MSMMLRELFQPVWDSECIPKHRGGGVGVIVSVFEKTLVIIEVSHC